MPVNRNALIRYKTIDTCLRNKYRQWTLEDLIDACSDALYEYEGIDKGISKRTVQGDIQMMRSEKLGYNAPIIVYDNKYYTYEDEDYSITDTPLTESDLRVMSEAVEVLRQFKGFGYFSEMGDIVSRLEDHVTSAKKKTIPVIDFEKNEGLKGLNYLDDIYHAIVDKKTLSITYQSFKAKEANTFTFFPYLLKEYRNRWFVYGHKTKSTGLMNLALDRIAKIEENKDIKYQENDSIDPSIFFKDLVGVTKNSGQSVEQVRFWVDSQNAPYVRTKPIHNSQKVIETHEDLSMTFEIEVIINQELQREIFGFAESVKVLSPKSLVQFFSRKYKKASNQYNNQ